MKALKWLDDNIERVCIVSITAIMTVCLFLQVVFRFFLKLPLAWTEEISINLLVWLCYYGSSYAVKTRSHLRIDILTNFMKPRMKSVFDIIACVAFAVFAVIVLYQLTLLTLDIMARGQITAVLRMPRWIIYGGVAFAFLLTIIRLVQELIRCVGVLRGAAAQPDTTGTEEG